MPVTCNTIATNTPDAPVRPEIHVLAISCELTVASANGRWAASQVIPRSGSAMPPLAKRHAQCGRPEPGQRTWVFPSPTSASGHLKETKHLYARISEAGGVKFWFQGMRHCYLAVAERDLLLPSSLTSRLLNRAPIGGIAAGHPADWTIERLSQPAQRIADQIQALMGEPEKLA